MRIHNNSGEPKTPRNFMSVCSLFSPCGTVTCACLIQVGSPASPQNSLRSFRGAPQARRDKHTPAPQANEKEKSKAERSRNHPLSRLGVRPRSRSAAFLDRFRFWPFVGAPSGKIVSLRASGNGGFFSRFTENSHISPCHRAKNMVYCIS